MRGFLFAVPAALILWALIAVALHNPATALLLVGAVVIMWAAVAGNEVSPSVDEMEARIKAGDR